MLQKSIDRLAKWIRPVAIPNLVGGIVVLQVVLFILGAMREGFIDQCVLAGQLVWQGEVWRIVTFLFVPPAVGPIFLFFHWYILLMMGSALEREWGTAKLNLFILIGFLANVAVALIFPMGVATNLFLYGTLFLAFAQLYPNFRFMLFFVLPIEVRWLALIAWIGYAWQFISAPSFVLQAYILASLANYLLFFGPLHISKWKGRHRRSQEKARHAKDARTPRNVCQVCGRSNLSDPQLEFRYCSQCSGEHCYCLEHLRDHEHVKETVKHS